MHTPNRPVPMHSDLLPVGMCTRDALSTRHMSTNSKLYAQRMCWRTSIKYFVRASIWLNSTSTHFWYIIRISVRIHLLMIAMHKKKKTRSNLIYLNDSRRGQFPLCKAAKSNERITTRGSARDVISGVYIVRMESTCACLFSPQHQRWVAVMCEGGKGKGGWNLRARIARARAPVYGLWFMASPEPRYADLC